MRNGGLKRRKTGSDRSRGSESVDLACPVCGSPFTWLRREILHDREYFVEPDVPMRVEKCSACASEFLFPRPSARDLISFYPAEYHAYNADHGVVAQALVSLRARTRARQYRRLLGDGRARIFDVGAGDCRHFDELRKFCDLECAGVELNSQIAAEARTRGYAIVDGTLEELDLEPLAGRFDIVSMNHVLEHVTDPSLALQRAFLLLRPGGYLIGQLPTLSSWEARLFGDRWGGYHYPRHLQMFSRRGLQGLLEDCGFIEVRTRSAPHIQTALSVQNALVGAGWRPKMRFGKTPIYSALLLVVAPFEVVAYLADRGGIIDFVAKKGLEP